MPCYARFFRLMNASSTLASVSCRACNTVHRRMSNPVQGLLEQVRGSVSARICSLHTALLQLSYSSATESSLFAVALAAMIAFVAIITVMLPYVAMKRDKRRSNPVCPRLPFSRALVAKGKPPTTRPRRPGKIIKTFKKRNFFLRTDTSWLLFRARVF